MSGAKISDEVANSSDGATSATQVTKANDELNVIPMSASVVKGASRTEANGGPQLSLVPRSASEAIGPPPAKLQKSASFKFPQSLTDAASIAPNDNDSKVWLEPRSVGGSFTQSRPASFAGGLFAQRSASGVNKSMTREFSGRRSGSVCKNPLDSINNKELVNAVEELQKSTRQYELENMVFLHFLEQHDPTLLEDMDSSLKTAQTMHDRASTSSRRLTFSRHSRRESFFLTASTSSIIASGTAEREGPKINITQKTDLILREMEEIEGSWQKLSKKCNTVIRKLKAELEEMSIRESELNNTMNSFESIFIHGTVEKYIQQKNPADKFTRFMEDCFKESRTTIDKLRLRTSSLKVQYHKICNQLTQKKLLGENLQEVDFEQLQIENKHLMEKIDKRNLLLLELKRMNGNANLLLSRTKKNLLKKMDDLKEIQETIKFREDLIGKLDDECEKVASELEDTKTEYDKAKEKSENYQVPPVIDYVKKKAELGVLKKNLKIWTRRKQIKDMALAASMREMKSVTGQKSTSASWFEIPDNYKRRDSVDIFEFVFERKVKEQIRARIQKRKDSKRFKH